MRWQSKCPYFQPFAWSRSDYVHPRFPESRDGGAKGLTARQRAAESDANATVARSDDAPVSPGAWGRFRPQHEDARDRWPRRASSCSVGNTAELGFYATVLTLAPRVRPD